MDAINGHWQRAIAFVDMNAFFASIEQLDYPQLRGLPIGVTNGMAGTCIITCSYEARAFGIRTGMRVKDAKKRCPHFIQRSARPQRYAQVSSNVMRGLREISPDVEVFSVDEAFIDVTHCQRLWGAPERIAHLIKQKVFSYSGINCSIGMSGDKTTAKYAGKLHKPNGLTVIPPWEAEQCLENVLAIELCHINKGVGSYLAKHGAFTCGDVAKLPISVLSRRFGNQGRRIWQMCQGKDPDPVVTNIDAPKTLGHGKLVPPDTRDRTAVLMYLVHMTEKVASRLRQHTMRAQKYFIGLKCQHGWIGDTLRTPELGNDSSAIITLCKQVIHEYWQDEGVFQVQVTALDPQPEVGQTDLFATGVGNKYQLNKAIDFVNRRFGEFTLAPAQLLNRSDMPNVISPGWKPYAHRQTIPRHTGMRDTPLVKTVYALDE